MFYFVLSLLFKIIADFQEVVKIILFKIIVDSQEVVEIIESCMLSTHFPQVVISYIIIVQYQDQEIDTDTKLVCRPCHCSHGCTVLYSFIPCIDSQNYHQNQDTIVLLPQRNPLMLLLYSYNLLSSSFHVATTSRFSISVVLSFQGCYLCVSF